MDYKLMCFPCLRKKKKLSSLASSSADLDEHFEYIVDKYTIRKVPLHVSATSEVSVRRHGRDEPEPKLKTLEDFPLKEKGIGDFKKIAMAPGEAYSVPRVTAVLPVSTHSSRSVKEKPRPADILDSTSPISRRTVIKPNYVVIPSKASLHVKDIMLTKREIANQYLNNFSSVFVDNLKDQVPKDPENLPKLSRPYTSAVKNLCIGGALPKSSRKKGDSCRNKVQKLVYSLPDGTVIETGSDADEGVASDEGDNDSPTLVHSSDIQKEPVETISAPFKSSIRGPSSFSDNEGDESIPRSRQQQPEASTSTKQITYEDIEALDVGYEFPNNEKYGVKPKMTRIRFTNLESDRSKELSSRTGYVYGIDSDFSRRPNDPFTVQSSKSHCQSGALSIKNQNLKNAVELSTTVKYVPNKDAGEERQKGLRLKDYYLAEPCDPNSVTDPPLNINPDFAQDKKAFYGEYGPEIKDNWEEDDLKNKTENFSLTQVVREMTGTKTKMKTESAPTSMDAEEKFSGNFQLGKIVKPCLKNLVRPSSVSSERSGSYMGSLVEHKTGDFNCRENINASRCRGSLNRNALCRSRSLESLTSVKKDEDVESSYNEVPFSRFTENRVEEPETETSNSLYSRESKASSLVTSTLESDADADKKATLRWKIIIKHHKDEAKGNGMPSTTWTK